MFDHINSTAKRRGQHRPVERERLGGNDGVGVPTKRLGNGH